MSVGFRSERLFAELCGRRFLRGFIFHSPRFYDPDEQEAGDVVIWVRRQVIVAEVLAREADPGSSTKQFIKRVGEKRKQLVSDYEAFRDPSVEIHLRNEQGEGVNFDKSGIKQFGFAGIILLDCDDPLEKPHFKSIAKTLSLPFPVAVMTRTDFLDLMSEIDTVPDLYYYLVDRATFLNKVYADQAHLFLDLNKRLERNLVSFYKLHRNRFPLSEWEPTDALTYYYRYHVELREEIAVRDEENADSYLIDDLIDELRSRNTGENSTLLHSWELASLSRRQRAGSLSTKIRDAITRMHAGNPTRHFAFFNQATGCWIVFFFQHGGERESFTDHAQMLTRYKLFVEIRQRDFEYSVFGYAFRKSEIQTDSMFDDVVLSIEDASDYNSVSDNDYDDALNYFGGYDPQEVREFPR